MLARSLLSTCRRPLSSTARLQALFGPEHDELRNSVNKFVDAELNPHVDEWENNKHFPGKQVFKKMAAAGFLGISKPVEFGGLGLDYSYTVAFAEELGNCDSMAVVTAIGVQTDMATIALTKFGSDKLRREFLTPSIAGDVVSCIGVSEPQAGSDVSSILTRAEKSGDDYVINGQKLWITNGVQADWICLLVNTSKEDAPHHNKSLICVPMNTPGVKVVRNIPKIGYNASDWGEIVFEDVRVPQWYCIGEENKGFIYQMNQFQEERLFANAASLKSMEKLIQQTIEYTRQRKVFGKSILDQQIVHYKLAELQTEIELLRSLTYRATEQYLAGQDVTKLVSMGKWKLGKLSRQVGDDCLQFWGAMGYCSESPVSRFYRDARVLAIGGGSDEVMLQVIAKLMGTVPKPAKR